ncbi:MAG: ABC transporter ATP-binding protein [Spirochaetaceae bacterium]|jgi:sulfonate transport system ATP-binding protein|nr:ABC transporter ATP-binding protein [Spirochaetaceae bacterium]
MQLRVRSLCKTYANSGTPAVKKGDRSIRALHRCSLEITGGTCTAVLGRSGCGKTTLLKIIAGLESPDSGTVEFTEACPAGSADIRAEPRLGFMFQDPRLLPWLTVEQNLLLAFPPPGSREEKQNIYEELHRTLLLVGLADRARAYPRHLSGGMAQRAALARCLCRKPVVLLLDEPFSSLDSLTRIRLREELDPLWRNLGLTLILVTHDIEEAVYLGSRVLLMENGAMGSEISIPLSRPRDYRSGEFQEYCRRLETGLAEITGRNHTVDIEGFG